ncbi:RNA-directed DNA polymerase, eukaryota, reverse transcriptase zinc-binding domain protein [Tanacetum coccineum]
MELKIASWNIRGLGTSEKQREVKKLIADEDISICGILETRLKSKCLSSICGKMFEGWNRVTNMNKCNKGCRIIVSWNADVADIRVIHVTSQVMLCLVETVNGGHTWIMMGDLNVTLKVNEHSVGGSHLSNDMQEFQDCVNSIEMEDLCCSGLHYTWTKNLYRTKMGRMQQNRVKVICDEDGNKYEENHVAEQFVLHFQKFLGTKTDVEELRDKWNEKAPGPDCFTAMFFKKSWEIMGKDVVDAIQEFFTSGKLLKEINTTIIALVPKLSTPNKLVNRNQSAFIPNRQIQDNILLTQEILKGYDRKGGTKRIACKIDIQKAYDILNWRFLEDSLKNFGFPDKMVRWIMVFTLIMERNVKKNSDFNFHFGYREMRLTHVCFADDLLMFYNGDLRSAEVIKKYIEEFEKCLGLSPNFDKSTIYFGSMNEDEKQRILEVLLFSIDKLLVRYLGVPLVTKRLGVKDYKGMLDKSSQMDKLMRKDNNGNLSQFSVKKAYEDLRENNDEVKWWKVLWFSQCIPKHAFILWMAINEKLLTQDRMKKWGSYDMMVCSLCHKEDGSHNHLFFQCTYSKSIWEKFRSILRISRNSVDWKEIVKDLGTMRNGKNISSVIRRICVAACVYMIWQERNYRIFRDEKRTWEILFKMVWETVRMKLMGLTVKD